VTYDKAGGMGTLYFNGTNHCPRCLGRFYSFNFKETFGLADDRLIIRAIGLTINFFKVHLMKLPFTIGRFQQKKFKRFVLKTIMANHCRRPLPLE